MKLRRFWQRDATEKEEPAFEEPRIDVSVSRECIYKEFEKHPGPCPRCGGVLQQSHQSYLVTTRRGKEIADSFIMGSDFGWFCTQCLTVVIDPREVSKMLQYTLPDWNVGTEFAVVGIVDLDAVPEEKRHLPFGGEDNPIPLVEFTHASPAQDERSFEERYGDVLQNIEFGIILVYHDHPEMTDWQALDAIEALLRKYQAEAKGRQVKLPSLDPLAEKVYDLVEAMCEWRLGRAMPFEVKDEEPLEFSPEPITLEEIIACLKRIRKSINRWSRVGGRQGYLNFVEQYIA